MARRVTIKARLRVLVGLAYLAVVPVVISSLVYLDRVVVEMEELARAGDVDRQTRAAWNDRAVSLGRQAERDVLVLLLMTALAGGALVILLPHGLLRPVHRLTQFLRQSHGSPGAVRLPPAGGDEIGDLVRELERVLAEMQALEDSRIRKIVTLVHRLRALAESAPQAVLVVDDEGKVQLANRHAREMFPALAAGSIGIPLEEVFPDEPLLSLLPQWKSEGGTDRPVLLPLMIGGEAREMAIECRLSHDDTGVVEAAILLLSPVVEEV